MTTADRRREILRILSESEAPAAARDLAARFGVSRQVIVQDLAVIRASHPHIISTYRGYVMQHPESGCTREFKVRHASDRTEEELKLIVDLGGWVRNISISHRVYGRMTADLDIRCRQDVRDFLTLISVGKNTHILFFFQAQDFFLHLMYFHDPFLFSCHDSISQGCRGARNPACFSACSICSRRSSESASTR